MRKQNGSPIDHSKAEIDHKIDHSVTWQRRRYRLTVFRDGWRIRSRARGDEFDWLFPACSLARAKSLALARFEQEHTKAKPLPSVTLEQVAKVYADIPKKAGRESAYNNVTRLRSIVRLALGKELERVNVSEVGPRLWNAYMAAKQGGKLDLSLSGRRPENAAINAAVRCAASIFIPRLRPLYRESGIIIPDDATVIQWLPVMRLPKPRVGAELIEEWRKLPHESPLFWTVGLARFAGLRQQEISACRRSWIVEDATGVYVEMQDRPDEGWRSKTGEIYRALVIDAAFARELLALPDGPIVRTPDGISRSEWFERKPQVWCKTFTGAAKKPLHRLRGLYADDVKRITQDAVAAHLAAVKAASQALGHTNTATTEQSYLSR